MTIKEHSQPSTIRTITKLNLIEKMHEVILTAPNPQYIKKENCLDELLRNLEEATQIIYYSKSMTLFLIKHMFRCFCGALKKIEKV